MLCMIFQRKLRLWSKTFLGAEQSYLHRSDAFPHIQQRESLCKFSLQFNFDVSSSSSCNCAKLFMCDVTKSTRSLVSSHLANRVLVEIVQLECYWWGRDVRLRRNRWFRWAHRTFVSWWRALCWAFDHAKSHNDPVCRSERIVSVTESWNRFSGEKSNHH